MARPRLLDLFCCEGAGSEGYARAGFDVEGVDLDRARGRYYPYTFHHADALAFLADHWRRFDALAASPPCQRHTAGNRAGDQAARHPDLIAPTREAFQATGVPYVIENVEGAPLVDPVTLCGTQFGLQATDDDGTRLRLKRHRLFESNLPLTAPGPCDHTGTMPWAGSYGGARRDRWEAKHVRRGGYVPAKHVQAALLGLDHRDPPLTQHGLYQSLPPVYTAHLGAQLLEAIR